MKNKPILFIAGAPRSGTSFLFNLLSLHPNIAPHKNNESYFFMNKNHPLRNSINYFDNDMKDYFSGFLQNEETTYLLDGTDHLMYQEEMYKVIGELPNTKMIFILREPANRIFSSFKFTKYNLGNFKEDISFKEYINGLKTYEENQIDRWFYNDKRSGYILKREIEYSHYINYIEEWINILGREHIFFIQFEHFIATPQIELNQLFSWLNLPSVNIDYARIYKNKSTGIKYSNFHKIVSGLRAIIPKSSLKQKLKRLYFKIQGDIKIENSEEDLETLKDLKKLFEKNNNRLFNKTSIDFFDRSSDLN